MSEASSPVRAVMAESPVIAVLSVERLADAEPLARALVAGGVRVLEITCRTDCAVAAAAAMAKAEPDAVVGLGTVLETDQMRAAADLGLRFAVSPGLDPAMVRFASELGLPFLPGVVTPSEVTQALRLGLSALKFFPAEAFGGVAALKALAGPFPQVAFCPTGGINQGNRDAYLALSSVPCVGGSWMAPKQAIDAGDWQAVTEAAKRAVTL